MENYSLDDLLFQKQLQRFCPERVVLCGSTRFIQAFQEANLRETLAGNIVLTIGCDTKSDAGLNLTEQDKFNLDLLHLYKIDLADWVYVLNVGGYVGASTTRELIYAARLQKLVGFLEPEHLFTHVCSGCTRLYRLTSEEFSDLYETYSFALPCCGGFWSCLLKLNLVHVWHGEGKDE